MFLAPCSQLAPVLVILALLKSWVWVKSSIPPTSTSASQASPAFHFPLALTEVPVPCLTSQRSPGSGLSCTLTGIQEGHQVVAGPLTTPHLVVVLQSSPTLPLSSHTDALASASLMSSHSKL